MEGALVRFKAIDDCEASGIPIPAAHISARRKSTWQTTMRL